MLQGFAWLLLCQSAGELLAQGLSLRLPGPVIGMLILLAALNIQRVRQPVGLAADALLGHLSLLFVPVGVGVMVHLDLLSQFGLRVLLVVVVSTLIGLLTTALVLRRLWRRGA